MVRAGVELFGASVRDGADARAGQSREPTLAARLWIAAIAVVALASSACSLGWDLPVAGAAGEGGSGGDGGALGGDGAVPAVGHVGADAGEAGLGASADAASYECSPSAPCGSGMVCHYTDHLCGKGEPGGRCVVAAVGCVSAPQVCGCNGTTYQDQCAANLASQDVSAKGNCSPPTSSDYACGYVFCWFPGLLPAQYCRQHRIGAEATYDCPFAPTGCDSYTCGGCAMSGCGTCQPLSTGGWMFDCP